MSTRVQWRRGNTAQTATFTGAVGEITVDTDKKVVVIHDGVTAGGSPAPTLAFVQAAFDAANNVAPQIQPTFNQANAAFVQANSAFLKANASYTAQNTTAGFANGAYITANAAFNTTNISFNTANSAYAAQNITADFANSAYTQANTAYTAASNAYNFATSINVYATAAYSQANSEPKGTSAGVFANGAFVTANSAASFANGAFTAANTAASNTVTIQGVDTTQNTNIASAQSFANSAFTVANSASSNTVTTQGVDATQNTNITSAQAFANGAFLAANSGASFANGAFVVANSAAIFANAAFTTANSGASFANSAFLVANSAASFANGAFVAANSGASFANAAFSAANSAASFANGAFTLANTHTTNIATIQGVDTTQNTNIASAQAFANGAFLAANSGASFANGAFVTANASYAAQNTTASFANAAFTVANSANAIYASGGTIAGTIRISNTTDSTTDQSGALTVAGGVGISKNLNVLGNTIISGSLTVTGPQFITSTNTTTYQTPILSLHDPAGNTFITNNDGYDIGIGYEYYDPSDGHFVILGGSGNGTTATLTVSDTWLAGVGEVVNVSGVVPSGFNGTYTITAASAGSISFLNSTNASVNTTGQLGIVYQLTEISLTSGTWSSQVANVAYSVGSPNITLTAGQSVTISGCVPSRYNGTYNILAAGPGYFTYTIGNPNPGSISVAGKVYLQNRHAFSGRSNDTGYFEFYESGNFDASNTFHGLYGTIKAGALIASPPQAISAAYLTAGGFMRLPTSTVYDVSTPANGIVAQLSSAVSYGVPTIGSANANVHYTNATTVYIAGAPVAGNNVTFDSNATYSLEIASGNTFMGGNLVMNGASSGIIFTDGTKQLTNAATYIYSFSGYTQANLAYTQANSAYTAQNTTAGFANAAYTAQNTTAIFANAAFTTANSGASFANGAFTTANSASSNTVTIQGVDVTQNTNIASAQSFANSAFLVANSAASFANGAFVTANSGASFANGAFTKANGAVQTGFTTISANGTSITPSSNADTFTITSAIANGINILIPSSKTIDFGLRTTGVTSGWYGGSTQIPSINVDSFGRITSIANNSVSTTINLAGGSGSGSVSGGGTLTLSGGTGITTSVSGSTITVTNSGVTSFNGSTGAVTFGSINVTNALGYTPANKAGDNFTGAVIATALTSNTGITLNTSGYITTTSFTTASVSQATVDSFATSTYRSAKYLAQMVSSTSYHVIELRVVHDGTTAWLAQYGEIYTGSSLGTFDASISAGNLNLLFTPTNASTTIKLVRTTIVV